jgi:hypothetical protein
MTSTPIFDQMIREGWGDSPAEIVLYWINQNIRGLAEMLSTPEAEAIHQANMKAFGL